MIYIHHAKPHENSVFNRLELFNEFTLIFFGNVMLVFVGLFETESSNHLKYGTSTGLLIIAVLVVANMLTMLMILLGRLKLKVKRC